MMDLTQIRHEADVAARRARGKRTKPYLLTRAVLEGIIEEGRAFPFPFIGSYTPRGFVRTKTFFVDASGFGAPGEPALPKEQFIEAVTVGRYYAIVEVGQFQCYVAEFAKPTACGRA